MSEDKEKEQREDTKRKAKRFRESYGWRMAWKYRRADPETKKKMLQEFGLAYRDLTPRLRQVMWLGVCFGVFVYGAITYLIVSNFLEPYLVAVYDFTIREAETIGAIVEADLISAVIAALIGFTLGRRSGKKEVEAIKELADEIRKDRESRESKRGEH